MRKWPWGRGEQRRLMELKVRPETLLTWVDEKIRFLSTCEAYLDEAYRRRDLDRLMQIRSLAEHRDETTLET